MAHQEFSREIGEIDRFIAQLETETSGAAPVYNRPEVVALREQEERLSSEFMYLSWEVKANGSLWDEPLMEDAWNELVKTRRQLARLEGKRGKDK